MVKKIIVTSCDNCPYSDFKMKKELIHNNTRFKTNIFYICNEDYVDVDGNEWRDTSEIPSYCPLEDER